MVTSERPWLTTWGVVIEFLRELGHEDMVCFNGRPSFPEEPCLVADSSELDQDDDYPPEAAKRGWTTTLIKEEIQGVLGNLESQGVQNPDIKLILKAVEFYLDNDAFLLAT